MRLLVVVLALVAVATGCATHVSPPARSTVIDATTGARRGTVPLGGVVAGNVAYDPASGHMLVDL